MIFENFSEKISSLKHVSKDLNLEEVSQKFEMYFNILVEENEKYNLTAITEKEEVYLKHFYDSLTLYRDIDLNKPIKICDVGSGAGFPGIVLKIFFLRLGTRPKTALLRLFHYKARP